MANTKKGRTFFSKVRRFLLYLLIANVMYIVITKWITPPITTVMISSLVRGNGLSRDYQSFDQMGRNCKLAVICAEDQLFPDHHGFDLNAIQKAIEFNKNASAKKIRGASTISQQTAKNAFLWNGRDWFRKGLEVYHTFMIELIWGKQRILETYLNIAEMGKGIFGIEAAAKHYFNKSANQLSNSEAAWIAAILPNPVKYSVDKPDAYLIKRHQWILQQMNHLSQDPETRKLID